MAYHKTPMKLRNCLDTVKVPASPFMKKIGYGTGVVIYEMKRSPACNKSRSPWAVKKLTKNRKKDKELDRRLKAEADLLRQLNHPNVVGFRAFTQGPDGRYILAMEECSTSLGDLIENRNENHLGPFLPRDTLKVMCDISEALTYLHNTALLVHCDIKSYNILINGEFDICKLCDFGVCMPLLENGNLNEEKAGQECEFGGTSAWAAPEVLEYPPIITSKVDIYAFGLVIWEMIALCPPVDDDFMENASKSFNESIDEIYHRQRPPLPDVDLDKSYEFILEVYYCCTEEDLMKRPNARELTAIFKEVFDNV